ncbi:protein kinase-like protein [Streptomyces sp. Ag109_G2-6]|uniref:serine/threonine-protein kinase n=1 Tax=Streptomyces sp. Ag109_G2-6 TaxID=2485154 RepID=UPI000F4E2FAE|nr:serine/threonine-protein kinase [Streptomyces sp. Ag109_G2-6]RPF46225.1 protein kinase-like protein [Streptomyces sp. Ag109_G2-6]
MHPLEAGEPRTIGAYRLLGRLGAGGMGRVYLGRSAGGRTVAVKVVHPHFASDAEFRARFRREVEAARRVGGEWTAPVLDADPEAAVPWVATGYVAGPSLDRAVAGHGPLPEGSVRAVGAGLARALVAVHGLGLVHRDVKPSNVMLSLDGPRLIDFGIARATDGTASLTSTGVSIGSPGYMSPEQILGKGVTGASDVFSLGAVLAFAATGRPPFSGDNSATLLYKVVHEPPELDAVPAGELRELIASCLAKAASERPSPEALAAALGGALGAPGWLPAPLVEEASRAAVALLDLDADASEGGAGAGAPGAGAGGGGGSWAGSGGAYGSGGAAGAGFGAGTVSGSGPVPFTEGSFGGPVGVGFGTPDPTYGNPSGYAGGAGPYGSGAGGSGFGTGPGGGPYGSGSGGGPYGSGSGTGPGGGPYGSGPGSGAGGGVYGAPTETAGGGRVPQPRTAADGERRGVTLSAAGRRFSCTLVLGAAAVLTALSGGLYGMGLLPGQGARDAAVGKPPTGSPAPDAAASAPSSPSSPSASGSAAPPKGTRDDVPQELTGTWKGTVTTNLGATTEFEITIRSGKVGEVVARDKSVLPLLGTDCSGDWKLSSATDRSLVLDSAGGPNPAPGVCAGGSADERFTLNPGGTLHYKSGDRAAGNPEGDLTRSP